MDTGGQITDTLKDTIYTQLADAMLEGLETNNISDEDSQKSSQYILTLLDSVKTQEELLKFLEDVSDKWPVYKSVFMSAQTQAQEVKENIQIQQAQQQLQTLQK